MADAVNWLLFVAGVIALFLGKEAIALASDEDESFTLSSWIKRLQRAVGAPVGRAATGLVFTALFVYLMAHLVFWLI